SSSSEKVIFTIWQYYHTAIVLARWGPSEPPCRSMPWRVSAAQMRQGLESTGVAYRVRVPGAGYRRVKSHGPVFIGRVLLFGPGGSTKQDPPYAIGTGAHMKAAVYRRYGPPDVVRIEEVPTPEPKVNEVLVKVRATT